jgi:hypothetical protein
MSWQPMDTAPRDGTTFLAVSGRNNAVVPCRWDDDRYAKSPKPYWSRSDCWGSRDHRANPPIVWQPMPTYP